MATLQLEKQYAFKRTLNLNYFNVGENKKNLTAEELKKRGIKIHQMILKSQVLDKEKFYKALTTSKSIKYQFGAQ